MKCWQKSSSISDAMVEKLKARPGGIGCYGCANSILRDTANSDSNRCFVAYTREYPGGRVLTRHSDGRKIRWDRNGRRWVEMRTHRAKIEVETP